MDHCLNLVEKLSSGHKNIDMFKTYGVFTGSAKRRRAYRRLALCCDDWTEPKQAGDGGIMVHGPRFGDSEKGQLLVSYHLFI
jgi:hypothetical protein